MLTRNPFQRTEAVMEMRPFSEICEKLAETETRSFVAGGGNSGVPIDEYGVLEFYCTDPDCDCRRVSLTIISRAAVRIEATIAFGFDRDSVLGPGVELDPLNPQGPFAESMLRLVKQKVLADRTYVARIRQHYAITKQIAQGRLRPQDAPASPCLSEYVLRDTAEYEVDPELDEILNAPRGSFLSRAERREAQREVRRMAKKRKAIGKY